MSHVYCPNCGHHIIDLEVVPVPKKAEIDSIDAEQVQRDEQVQRFVNDKLKSGGRENTVTVLAAYRQWCSENDEPQASSRAVGLSLRRLGVTQVRASGKRYYSGIHL